ncbi:39402_t:CDS:1, partial [Gigaspora margarita]
CVKISWRINDRISTELLKMYPNNENILRIRAQAFTAIGKYDEALIDLNRLLESNCNNELQHFTAIGKYDEAIIDLNRLLE